MVVIHFTLSIAEQMESEFVNLMPLDLAKELVRGLFPTGMLEEEPEEEAVQAETPLPVQEAQMPEAAPLQAESTGSGGKLTQEEIDRLKAMTATAQQPDTQPVEAAPPMVQTAGTQDVGQAAPVYSAMQELEKIQQAMVQQMQMMQQMQQQTLLAQQQAAAVPPAVPKQINVHTIPSSNLSDRSENREDEVNMDLVLGVPVEVSVEIGRTKKYVKDVLELNKGSLVVLDKLAGEQVDLFVNGQCIAKGDVVVVDDNFGIRITEILRDDIEVAL